jgi:site-specific DNA-methyltransferase (adenine-specific)
MDINKVYLGDCLEIMPSIPDKSIDMVLCDLPYGSTACSWDTIIPFELLWKEYKRIIKKNGAIVLTASQPFTSILVCSNLNWYRHHWVWIKEKGTGFQVAKYRPMMKTEDIIMFRENGGGIYNPQMTLRDKPLKYHYPTVQSRSNPLAHYNNKEVISTHKYPENTLIFQTETGTHPTQKPVALFEYLIKTYTNEGDLVLDNCAGSGTTGVACQNLNRNYILIEKEPKYYDIILKRLSETQPYLTNE